MKHNIGLDFLKMIEYGRQKVVREEVLKKEEEESGEKIIQQIISK